MDLTASMAHLGGCLPQTINLAGSPEGQWTPERAQSQRKKEKIRANNYLQLVKMTNGRKPNNFSELQKPLRLGSGGGALNEALPPNPGVFWLVGKKGARPGQKRFEIIPKIPSARKNLPRCPARSYPERKTSHAGFLPLARRGRGSL